MQEFSATGPLVGGALIGLSASLLLLFNGRVAGISGIFGGLLFREPGGAAWRAAFVAGLLLGGLALAAAHPGAFPPAGGGGSLGLVVAAGLLVGLGARLGNGCTSGHGVCGLSRLSVRSLVATMTFMATAAITVYVSHHVLGAAR
ncbi:YeeE/YedE thiosulfate transporter family protein [Sorangium sp. So ce260]|uniref:YeeE/YedE family protein n=1 Tax=Sorangium sp. So ce260 TaxID=3133291 RepID=UPI003F5DD0F6